MPNPAPAVQITPVEVHVTSSFEDAFRRFKNLVQKEKIIGHVKEKMQYEKPSEKKRRKTREAIEKRFIAELRERQIESGEWDKRKKRKEALKLQKQERKIREQESL